MELKKITLPRLRKLVFDCKKSTNDCPFINELDLVISDDPKDKKSYREKIKFIYTGVTNIYRKKNLKKYTHTFKDYKKVEIKYNWLEDKKNKQENDDLVYIIGLIKFKDSKSYMLTSLQVCDNNEIAYKCMDGLMVYSSSKSDGK